mgnify:CR=1 FL=1
MKTTAIVSVLYCIFGLKDISDYFINGEKMKQKIQDDQANKYSLTKDFIDTLKIMNPENFNAELAGTQFFLLRLLLFGNEERLISQPELSVTEFIQLLF